jgi:succinyl-diaminopimelate desuccinylase
VARDRRVGWQTARVLDLTVDVEELTCALVDVQSVSGNEKSLAEAVEAGLRAHAHLTVERRGNTIVARTSLGRADRVVIAGHLDTVPEADNLPHRRVGDRIYGLGACDM